MGRRACISERRDGRLCSPGTYTRTPSIDVCRGGALPRPLVFRSFLPPAGHFLSRKKVTKERFKERGISISPFP